MGDTDYGYWRGGIALSKYSLSLPIFLFLLYEKNFKVLVSAIAVQVIGVVDLAVVDGNSPITVAMENYRLFFQLFDQPGVHLARPFEIITHNHLLTQIPVLMMTLLVLSPSSSGCATAHLKQKSRKKSWIFIGSRFSKREQALLLVFMALIPPILILPARIVVKVIHGYYGTISDAADIDFLRRHVVCLDVPGAALPPIYGDRNHTRESGIP